jgi:hypothetical protein
MIHDSKDGYAFFDALRMSKGLVNRMAIHVAVRRLAC